MAEYNVFAGYNSLNSALEAAVDENIDFYPNKLKCETEDILNIMFTAFDDGAINQAYYRLTLRVDRSNKLYVNFSVGVSDNASVRLNRASGLIGLPNGRFIEYDKQASSSAGDTGLVLLNETYVGDYNNVKPCDIMITLTNLVLEHGTIKPPESIATNTTMTANKYLEAVSIVSYYTRPTGLFDLQALCNESWNLSYGETVYSDDTIVVSGNGATDGINNNIIGYRLRIEDDKGNLFARKFVQSTEKSCSIDASFWLSEFFGVYGGNSANLNISISAVGELNSEDPYGFICPESESVSYDSITIKFINSIRPKAYVYTEDNGWVKGACYVYRKDIGWKCGTPQILK